MDPTGKLISIQPVILGTLMMLSLILLYSLGLEMHIGEIIVGHPVSLTGT